MQIKLNDPIQAHGETVDTLTLPDKVTVKDLKAMDAATGEVGKIAALIGALAGIPPSSVDQMSAADFGRVSEALSGFLPDSPATGRM
jgi:hypothetical protein